MKSNKFIFEEFGLKKYASKELIMGMINHQINHCKLEYLSQWERSHSTTSTSKNQKIEVLEAKKRALEVFFDACNSDHSPINFNVSIELKEMNTNTEHS